MHNRASHPSTEQKTSSSVHPIGAVGAGKGYVCKTIPHPIAIGGPGGGKTVVLREDGYRSAAIVHDCASSPQCGHLIVGALNGTVLQLGDDGENTNV